MSTHTETDSLGSIEIDAARYWGPQTERARRLFRIGEEHFPAILIRAIGLQKQAAAQANLTLGELSDAIATPIITAAMEVAGGQHDQEFPLPVWQTGSGTQTNMNANEVIANRAGELLGQPRGSRAIHPNDHVNRGQSSNDSFPTMMHIAAVEAVQTITLPGLRKLAEALSRRAAEWDDIVKIGRTHMMDAVPMRLGQEAGAWARQVSLGIGRLERTLPNLLSVPQGGTAVGTGLNRHPDFDRVFCERLASLTGHPFSANPNKFEGMGAHDAFVELSGAMNTVAVSLNKIGNDVRLLGSGPRTGLAELLIPEDGLSSSIMPGKTNPTQSEALTMVCAQVMGNHVAITIGAAQSLLELNVFKPLIIHNTLQSTRLLGDAAASFAANMIDKLEPNREHIAENLANSAMLVTALNPHIGYDKAVRIAKAAIHDRITLKQAAEQLGLVTPADFDRWVQPAAMTSPGATLAGG
jgi:fumarate hydratase class II